MGARRSAAGTLAVFGGALMVASGFVTHGIMLTLLQDAQVDLSQYLGGLTGLTVALTIDLVSLLIGLGGFTVASGGAELLLNHVTLGRTLIALGGASGLLGFAISFGYTAYRLGLDSTLAYAPYWVGVFVAVGARRLAKGSGGKP